ncbi:patched family protein [Dictyocaulus viviparus]|uniref:Patched family protein n=1 Tax=Dictyocaulus viviparus TaxID=29172 RepID=A0A0D8Y5C1_DICVI|nr:patched family protein [Dictyocaulus viviparus]
MLEENRRRFVKKTLARPIREMSSEEGKALCEKREPIAQFTSNPHVSHSILIQPRTKTNEFLNVLKSISLKGFFRIWGTFIGQFPLAFLISGGIVKLHLRDNVRDGYTPRTSRSRQETDLYREFLGSAGDPAMTTVLMLAKDNGSMHRLAYLQKKILSRYILKVSINNMTLVRVKDVVLNKQLQEAVQTMQALYQKTMDPGSMSLQLTYPIADLRGIKLHLERNFYGVQITNDYNITNIKYIKVISMSFMAEIKTTADTERLGIWELALFDYCTKYTAENSSILELLVIGAEIVDTEMNKDGQRMSPYFATGFSIMFAFVCITVCGSSLYFDRLRWNTIVVAVSCAIVPVLAITTTFGLSSSVGNRTNSLMLIMPFLIMGIGVNDSFLTVHAWLRQPLRLSAAARLGKVLEEVGPSITTTTLTNVVTFLIGWLTPTEEISIFCFGSAMALGFAYIYTVIIFCPILYYCSPEETKEAREGCFRRKGKRFFRGILLCYSRVLSDRRVALVLFIGTLVYWYFGIMGTISITAKLDTEKILPKDTPIHRPNRLIENIGSEFFSTLFFENDRILWAEYYPVTVIVNSPVDVRDVDRLNYVNAFVDEFEQLSTCRGSNFTMFWLRDYINYYWGVGVNDFDFYFDGDEYPDEKEFGYKKLPGFLGNPLYKHHKAFLNLDYNQTVSVRKFSLVVVYENNTSWDDRIDLMLKWRAIISKFKRQRLECECYVRRSDVELEIANMADMFMDIVLYDNCLYDIHPESCFGTYGHYGNRVYQPWCDGTCLWTLFCMTIVCTIFIQNPVSVLMATMAIASISLGVMGYLSFWHLDLDPVSLCAVLISIGMAVDFVAHTTYHYQLSYREVIRDGHVMRIDLDSSYARIRHTISNIAWPMSQAGISTNYIPLVFVKTITLVVIWGLWHGLVLLPAFLSQIPLYLLNFNCYRLLVNARGDVTLQEMSLLEVNSART